MIKTLSKQLGEFKKDSLLTPLFMVLEVLMETIIPLLMASIIDDGVEKGDIRHICVVGAGMVVLAAIGLAAGVLGGAYGARASAGLARNLRQAMFENIQTFSFASIDKFSTSSLITRLTTDITNVQNAYQMILRMCVRAPISMICAMAMAFFLSPELACVYLVAVIVLGIILALIMRRATVYFKQAFPKYDDLNASVQENVSGIRVVKAYVREQFETSKFMTASRNIYNIFVKAERQVVITMPLMFGTVFTCILLISWLGAKMIVSSGQTALTTGELTSLLAYCMNILMSLMILSMVFVMVTMSMASAQRIAQVLEEKSELENPADPIFEVPDGSIRFDHVSFRYNETCESPVLNDISLDIRSGETVGIIGGTGSGKTSLVNLISRLYDVSAGAIYVGGHDVRCYDMEALRNQVAVVLQKNVLFSGSVIENLRWGNEHATREECVAACQVCCADEFISKMPDGYDSHVERGGANLSGGQRQRLCIARALLKKPRVLILDDSTSAVDTATDAKIRTALSTQLADTTKIIIAQRVSSVQSADRIIVMDDGAVCGFDTHERLLETNAIYRSVYESQTQGGGDFDENGGED